MRIYIYIYVVDEGVNWKDGFFFFTDFLIVLTSLGERLTNEEVDELVKCVEIDKNGMVHYETFIKAIMSS